MVSIFICGMEQILFSIYRVLYKSFWLYKRKELGSVYVVFLKIKLLGYQSK